jgi:hypothetical protein
MAPEAVAAIALSAVVGAVLLGYAGVLGFRAYRQAQ